MDALEEAQNLVRGNKNVFAKKETFDTNSFVYKKTNERLQDMPDILENKKKVLCVIGSGDQVLNALLSEPEKIDAFDISIFPRYFLELKIAAIKTLTREEYISFFIDDIDHRREEYYDDLFFEKIAKELGEEERKFWQYLFDYNDWYDIYNSTLFSSEPVIKSYALTQNKYLREEEYYKLREILKNTKIRYINSDILNLEIDEEYDLIYLSNIVQYVDKHAYKSKVEDFASKIKGIIVTYLFSKPDAALEFFEGSSARSLDTNSIIIHQGKQLIKRK